MVAAIVIVGILALLFVVGAVVGSAGGAITKRGDNDLDAECADACEQLHLRQDEFCAAKAERERAERAADRAGAQFAAAVAAAALFLGMAIIVAQGSLFVAIGLVALIVPIATVAVGAGAVLAAAAVFALGAVAGAQASAARASSTEEEARAAKQEAVSIVRRRCSAADADACLARLMSCQG